MIGHAAGEVYDGGTGIWNTNPSNTDWSPGTQAWTNGNDAYFQQPTNSVTVSGAVTSNYIEIDGGATSPVTISGGTIDQLAEDTYNPTILNDFSNAPVTVSSQIVLSDMGPGTLDVYNNNFQQGYIGNYGTSNLSLGSIDWGAYTINTDLNTSGQGTPQYDNHGALRILNIDAAGAGASVTFTGDYTNDNYAANSNNTSSEIVLGNGGDAGTYNISSTANFANFVKGATDTNSIYLNSGILNINNSTLNGNVAPTAVDPNGYYPLEAWLGATSNATAGLSTINIVGSRTLYLQGHFNPAGNGIYGSDGADLTGAVTIQQSGPGSSVWEGTDLVVGNNNGPTYGGELHQNGGNLIFGATTVDSRLNINADIGGSGAAGLTFTGPGVVVLSNAAGNDYNQKDDQGNVQGSSTVAATIETGATVLITNTADTSSAFGGSWYNYSNYSVTGGAADHATYQHAGFINNKVILQAGATLGGTGISQNQIVAEGATSTITAGDPGQAGLGILPSIGALSLEGGGLLAANGLTLDFKLDAGGDESTFGHDNDFIYAGNLTLGGTVNVNFTSVGGVRTGVAYLLMQGADWNINPATQFNFTLPTGYALDMSAFNGNGYSFSEAYGTFEVQFVAVPEPSTYALMFIGAGALVLMARRKLA